MCVPHPLPQPQLGILVPVRLPDALAVRAQAQITSAIYSGFLTPLLLLVSAKPTQPLLHSIKT